METVVLEVPSNLANRLNGLSLIEKRNFFKLIEHFFLNNDRIEQERQKGTIAFLKLMDEISQTAIERGMTEENFNDILKEALIYES